jgi:hypothetical protein
MAWKETVKCEFFPLTSQNIIKETFSSDERCEKTKEKKEEKLLTSFIPKKTEKNSFIYSNR